MTQRSKFRNFLDALRAFLFFDPLIYVYTLAMGTLSLLSSFFDKHGSIQHWFARSWSWLILKTIFSPVEVIGRENIPGGPAVYAANHQSAMDIPLLYTNLPMQFRIIAKLELFKYPFMGWHLRRSGQIPIDETDMRSNLRSIQRAVETVKSGMPVVVFPEGGRSPDAVIRDFKPGAFRIATKAGVPIIPMAIVGTFEVLRMNSFVIRPGRLQLVIGQPITAEGYANRELDKLSDRVKAAIEDMYYSRAKTPRPDPESANTTVAKSS